jgi:hypothetical protein
MGLDERREPQPELRELTAKLEAAKGQKGEGADDRTATSAGSAGRKEDQ